MIFMVALLAALSISTGFSPVRAQGTGQDRCYFCITTKTTKADAQQYLRRVFESMNLLDRQRRPVRVSTGLRGSCGLEFWLESSETLQNRTVRRLTTNYAVHFRDVLDVNAGANTIQIVGGVDAESYGVDSVGGDSGPLRDLPRKTLPERDVTFVTASPHYDTVKALIFLTQQCGGGAKFRS